MQGWINMAFFVQLYLYIISVMHNSCGLVKGHLKGSPVQNYHNFKRKSKNFPTDWCKNYENRMRNKEVETFWNFTFFRKTFLDQSLWIFKWASWWCHALTIFSYVLYMKFRKILIISSYWLKSYPISTYIRVNIFSHLLWVVIRQVLYFHSGNMRFLSYLYMKLIENCEGMTSSTRSFEYS